MEYIYRHIWNDKENGGDLHAHLRKKHGKHYSRSRRNDYRGRIPNQVSIDVRPSVVDEKERFGDLEIDLVVGKDHKGELLTINDRASSIEWIRKVDSKDADVVARMAVKTLMPLKGLIKTITSDNGREFARHEWMAAMLDIDYYFAHPYHSWERGANENGNGLIRQYFLKGTLLENIEEDEVAWVEGKMNNRPRKKLDYMTPKEYIYAQFNLCISD